MEAKKHGHGTRHGHTDTAFLKKVGHGHVEDTLIFNNIIIINLIISNHIHGHNATDLLLLSLGLDGRMYYFLFR